MNNHIAIDIGSENIKIISVLESDKDHSLKIKSKASYPSSGLSYGYITNQKLFIQSLLKALRQFKKDFNFKIEEAFISLDGFGLKGHNIKVSHNIASGLISDFDIEKIHQKAEVLLRKKTKDSLIEKIIIKYQINDFTHFNNPVGLEARKIEAHFLFITQSSNNLALLEESLEKTRLNSPLLIPSLLASAEVALSDLDKKLGCALVDFGAEKTSIIIFEDNKAIYYNVLKGGSKDISTALSLANKIDFPQADKLKKSKVLSKKDYKIISEKIREVAQKINNEINTIGKEGLLPSGICLIGGGSKIEMIEKIFKEETNLPIKKPQKNISDNKTDYYGAYGLILLGIKEEEKYEKKNFLPLLKNSKKVIKKLLKKIMI